MSIKGKLPEEDRVGRSLQKPHVPKPEFMAEYTVVAGDSLSKIALAHYGSAAQEKWMLIYEANKGIIGDNPSLIKPGQVLKIPKAP